MEGGLEDWEDEKNSKRKLTSLRDGRAKWPRRQAPLASRSNLLAPASRERDMAKMAAPWGGATKMRSKIRMQE